MSEISPIVLFCYNRPDNTMRTLDALKKNDLAKESDLYIFSDGAKNEQHYDQVTSVRKIITEVKGFNNVQVHLSDENCGLANSVIKGVTNVINKYGRVIVLEDDLITSNFFLNYMNEALDHYQDNKKIWSISGYTPELSFPKNYNSDTYLIPRASSWGWATWRDRWDKNDWDIRTAHEFLKKRSNRLQFNKTGTDMSNMLLNQLQGRIDSWAIRWCYNQFQNNSCTVYPRESFIKNIGLSDNATHGSLRRNLLSEVTMKYNTQFSDEIINEEILKLFSKQYGLKPYNYAGILMNKLGLYRMVKPIYKKVISKL